MRLKDSRVSLLAQLIVDVLEKEDFIECEDPNDIVNSIRRVIIDDLMVEDKLDDEVRDLLRQHQNELDKRRLEYFKMFRMVKEKLIRERNLII